MKDKYFLLNGRSYPDTVTPECPMTTADVGWSASTFSQPLPSIINIPAGKKALLQHFRPGCDRVPDVSFAGNSDERHWD